MEFPSVTQRCLPAQERTAPFNAGAEAEERAPGGLGGKWGCFHAVGVPMAQILSVMLQAAAPCT